MTTTPNILDTIIKDAQSVEALVQALIAQFAPQYSAIVNEIVVILNAVASATGGSAPSAPPTP